MRSPRFYYAAFFVTGVATVGVSALVALRGTSLPPADGEIGRLIAAQFTGQLIGSYFVGRQVASRLVLGAGVAALSLTALLLAGHLSQPLLFLLGLGLGLSMASINTLAGLTASPRQRGRRLEILNIFWPLGAAFCPWLVARLPAKQAFHLFFLVLALAFYGIAALASLNLKPASLAADEAAQTGPAIPLYLSCFALLAVGVESGLANWLPTYQLRYLPSSPLPLPLATLFWASILGSRMLASRWLRRRPEGLILVVSTLVAAVASLTLCVVHASWVHSSWIPASWIPAFRIHASWLLALAVAGIAAALGPIYPLLLSHALQLRGRGLVFFSASSGSALFPWLIGLAAISHPLKSAFLIPVLGNVLLFFFSLRFANTFRRSVPG